jgi:hypothetical protein
MFTIAGPVLVYGISASIIYGLIYYFVVWGNLYEKTNLQSK